MPMTSRGAPPCVRRSARATRAVPRTGRCASALSVRSGGPQRKPGRSPRLPEVVPPAAAALRGGVPDPYGITGDGSNRLPAGIAGGGEVRPGLRHARGEFTVGGARIPPDEETDVLVVQGAEGERDVCAVPGPDRRPVPVAPADEAGEVRTPSRPRVGLGQPAAVL